MPIGIRRRHRSFEVPIQDLMLRITGPEDLYEEARAAGMQFWEQIQSYAIRHPGFQVAKRAIPVPDDAPEIVRGMIDDSAAAGVGPMFAFRGALVEFVGRRMVQSLGEVVVTCGEDHFVVSRRRARLGLRGVDGKELGIVIKPELGPHGVFSSVGSMHLTTEIAEGIAVVARSCMLADATAAGITAILAKPGSFRAALAYVQAVPGVHGAIVMRGERIGVAGALELAA